MHSRQEDCCYPSYFKYAKTSVTTNLVMVLVARLQMQVLCCACAEPQGSAIFKLTKSTLYLLDGCYEIKGAFYATLFMTNVSANHPPLCSSKSILGIEYKTQHILGTWVTMEWDYPLHRSSSLASWWVLPPR